MKAVLFLTSDGTPGSTIIEDRPTPDPGPGEVAIDVIYAGLNFADLMMRTGIYPHPKGYPMVPGIEASGTVRAVGAGVTRYAPGDRVAAFVSEAGAFAEVCVVPEDWLMPLPDDLTLEVGAAYPIQALTAWNLLHGVADTKAGETVLIHAIGGGVGLYLTQFAKLAGATVIGTVGTRGKEVRALEYGADIVVNRDETDFVQVAMEATDGRGVDKVIDSTGASILDRSFDAIRPLGHVVSYGEAEGKPWDNLWERLVRKSLTFTRMHLGHFDRSTEAWKKGVDEVVGAIRSGAVKVPVEGIYPMEEVDAMFAALASRQTAGKLLMKIG
ncbi:MAG: NADPH:quinone reductase [Rhodobacteraceae bacterium]|nr:NADPH:quinone reductase [Paracoccaceae bacterium]MAY43753.1 NADPH:quinone reductase [Paracoccaceae bacterium]